MRRALAVVGLAALAGVSVLLLVALIWGRGGGEDELSVPIPADPAPAIQANAVLVPRTVTFGDTVTARVDVTLNRTRIDADTVRIATDFAPWSPTGEPERMRRDGETTTHLRSTWRLRCLASACLPPGQGIRIPLAPATVTYDRISPARATGLRLTARWPLLIVHTRLDPAAQRPTFGGGSSPFESPWRADMVAMPAVSYRVDPETTQIPLYAGAGAFALLGLALAYIGRPRRRPKPVVVPAEPPRPVLTPVEHALALLEDAVAADGAADRRRALELVAAELAGRGNQELAHVARTLAWSKQAPPLDRTTPLAGEARPVLGLGDDEEPEEDEPGA